MENKRIQELTEEVKRFNHQRLTPENLLLIRKLTDEGESLSYISKQMNVSKTTIYYQVRKFKPRIKKDFIVELNDFQIGELIGAFTGDGNYFHKDYNKYSKNRSSNYRVTYFLTYKKELEYARYIKELLTSMNLNPFSYQHEGAIGISVNSKDYIEFIKKFLIWEKNKTLSICLRKDIQFSESFLRGFARGLMDTDGYVEISNVSCACISKELINNLARVFDQYGIRYKLTEKQREGRNILYLVRVYRDGLEKYKELIGFSNSHKIRSLNKIIEKGIVSIKKP